MSSGIGFFCFATLSYSECLSSIKISITTLSKTIAIYLQCYNSKWHVLLCSLFVFFLVLFSLAHTFHFHSFHIFILTLSNLSFSSAIFFSQTLTLSLSFFCRGDTSILSVWMQCLTQSRISIPSILSVWYEYLYHVSHIWLKMEEN